MIKKAFLLTISIILTAILPNNIFAWSITGHRIIAQIAQDNIKPTTRKKINKLLDNIPMAYWANWADFIKSDNTGKWKNTYVWHYVNAPSNMGKIDFIKYLKGTDTDNLYKSIKQLENILSNNQTNIEEQRTALIFLIHLVGDAHQPMHVGRVNDMGGNKITVKWFGENTNLHNVWDSKLIDYEKYSYTEYAYILNTIQKNKKKELQSGGLEDWLYEVHTIANEIYETTNIGDNLSYNYTFKYKTIVESQLQKGGLRLAAMLDQVFK